MSRKGKAPVARSSAAPATPVATPTAVARPMLRWIVAGVVVAALGAGAWLAVGRSGSPDGPPLPAAGSIDDAALDARIREFADAVVAAPSDAEAWAHLAMTYHVHELFPEAAACYARSLALDPSQTQRRWLHALTLDAQGRFDDAIAEAQRVFREDAQYAPARAIVARWHLARGDVAAALELARRAVALAPDGATERVVLALVLVEQGEFAEAETAARGALGLTFARPQDEAYAHFVLGRALQGLGHADEARIEIARGRDADGRTQVVDPWAFELGAYQVAFRNLMYAAHDAVRAGQPGTALPILFELQRRDPAHVQVAIDLGRALRELNRGDEAYEVLATAVEKHPAEVALRVETALTLERGGDDERALEQVSAAIGTDSGSAKSGEALETRGMIHYRRGRWADAQRDFDAAFRADPSRPWVLVHAGMARLESDDAAGAEAYFQRCVDADPGIADAYAGLAIVAVQRGDLALAERHLALSHHLERGGTALQRAAETELAAARTKPGPR